LAQFFFRLSTRFKAAMRSRPQSICPRTAVTGSSSFGLHVALLGLSGHRDGATKIARTLFRPSGNRPNTCFSPAHGLLIHAPIGDKVVMPSTACPCWTRCNFITTAALLLNAGALYLLWIVMWRLFSGAAGGSAWTGRAAEVGFESRITLQLVERAHNRDNAHSGPRVVMCGAKPYSAHM
jgi:hypothetical protein